VKVRTIAPRAGTDCRVGSRALGMQPSRAVSDVIRAMAMILAVADCIQIGDNMPAATLLAGTDNGGEEFFVRQVAIAERLKGKNVVLLGMPSPYTPS